MDVAAVYCFLLVFIHRIGFRPSATLEQLFCFIALFKLRLDGCSRSLLLSAGLHPSHWVSALCNFGTVVLFHRFV
jgi:hypothetical protein